MVIQILLLLFGAGLEFDILLIVFVGIKLRVMVLELVIFDAKLTAVVGKSDSELIAACTVPIEILSLG